MATGLLAQGLATPQTLRVGARRPDVARAHAEPLGLAAVHPEEAADHAQILVLEAMAEGAVMRGMPRAVALELAARVALGSAEMLLATGRPPASLRDDVTTPAGCTIAGLLALKDGRIRSVLARGVETAAKVAGELAS